MRHAFLLAAVAAVISTSTYAGPYEPAAGLAGSTAIAKASTDFTNWATAVTNYSPGTDVSATFQTPLNALGAAATNIVSLGNGGSITLSFGGYIVNGAGADFAVFENGFTGFLELARVEVSSNGTDFFRFPAISLTPGPVGAFQATMDPTNLDGFAGKYVAGFGTPFDLSSLSGSAGLDVNNVRYVRIVDVLGNGTEFDDAATPHAIYDPFRTTGSGGFDLESVGVLHFSVTAVPEPEQYALLAAGLAVVAGIARRRQRRPSPATATA